MKIERMQYDRSIHARKDIERAINQRNSKQSFSAIDPDSERDEKREHQQFNQENSAEESESHELTQFQKREGSNSLLDIVV